MPLATCIRTFRGGPKSYFEKDKEYEYTKHQTPNGRMYSVTGERKDYITMFYGDGGESYPKFSTYFASKKELREKKIKDLLA